VAAASPHASSAPASQQVSWRASPNPTTRHPPEAPAAPGSRERKGRDRLVEGTPPSPLKDHPAPPTALPRPDPPEPLQSQAFRGIETVAATIDRRRSPPRSSPDSAHTPAAITIVCSSASDAPTQSNRQHLCDCCSCGVPDAGSTCRGQAQGTSRWAGCGRRCRHPPGRTTSRRRWPRALGLGCDARGGLTFRVMGRSC